MYLYIILTCKIYSKHAFSCIYNFLLNLSPSVLALCLNLSLSPHVQTMNSMASKGLLL